MIEETILDAIDNVQREGGTPIRLRVFPLLYGEMADRRNQNIQLPPVPTLEQIDSSGEVVQFGGLPVVLDESLSFIGFRVERKC